MVKFSPAMHKFHQVPRKLVLRSYTQLLNNGAIDMNPQNTQALYSACPLLYRGRKLPLSTNLMAAGFGCGDGRFELLMKYSKKLESHLEALRAAGTPEADLPMAAQVRDHRGAVQLVLNRHDDVTEVVVAEIAYHSQSVCDACGNVKARPVDIDGRVRTLCHYHATRFKTAA